MVVGKVNGSWNKSSTMESKSLKFGMDRILSEDTKRKENCSEDSCESTASCVACASSFYGCRPSTPAPDATVLFKTNGGISLPFRLYSNVLHRADKERSSFNSEGHVPKRKKSWSRAVFSNLQRKGLEKRFQLQKYITKPDRRQLAATLGLTDAQVKVWFQNRRMKWRHARESPSNGGTAPDCSRLGNPDVDSDDDDVDVDVQTLDN